MSGVTVSVNERTSKVMRRLENRLDAIFTSVEPLPMQQHRIQAALDTADSLRLSKAA